MQELLRIERSFEFLVNECGHYGISYPSYAVSLKDIDKYLTLEMLPHYKDWIHGKYIAYKIIDTNINIFTDKNIIWLDQEKI